MGDNINIFIEYLWNRIPSLYLCDREPLYKPYGLVGNELTKPFQWDNGSISLASFQNQRTGLSVAKPKKNRAFSTIKS